MLTSVYRTALLFQLIHVLLCVIWNGIGLWQQAQDVPTIGPTASIGAIALVFFLALGLVALLRRGADSAYLGLSVVGLALATLAIHGGFTKAPSLWPSEFWRYAGIAVNTVGVMGFLMASITYFRRRKSL